MLQRTMRSSRRTRITLLAFVWVAAWLAATAPLGAGGGPALLGNASSAPPAITSLKAPHIVRSRYATVNKAVLFDAEHRVRDAASLPKIRLNLFPNVDYIGEVEEVKSDGSGATWHGRLNPPAEGRFYITIAGDAVIAHVASPEGIYEVSFAEHGLYRVIEIDQSRFRDHPEDQPSDLHHEIPANAAHALSVPGDPGNIIDILVVYTEAARNAEGGTAAMNARIKLAVDQINTSYANSSVKPRLRLVHAEEVKYIETGNLTLDLKRLLLARDRHMDEIHSLRNAYGADMVALIVEQGSGSCGMAGTTLASPSTAFQVTARVCATAYYSFAHEFGHLQGARHDMYIDPMTWPYPHGHGYVHPYTANFSKRWRTIMAYDHRCIDWGYNCTRLPYWSNPYKTYAEDPLGDLDSDNHQVLNDTAHRMAGFRKQKIGEDFDCSFNTSASGWSAVRGKWGLYGSAYYGSNGAANALVSAKRNAVFGDLTYEVRMKRDGSCSACFNHISIRGKPKPVDSLKRWSNEYKFAYTNSGFFSVRKIMESSETVLKELTPSSAIVENGWNTLKVVAVGPSMNFYINGARVWSGTDPDLKTGQVGVGFHRDANPGTLLVDWAKLSNSPLAPVYP